MIVITNSPKETRDLAGFLFTPHLNSEINKMPEDSRYLSAGLKKFTKVDSKSALIIALEGELGAGKTTFVKGLAKSLGGKSKIKSPTFVLIKKYPITKNNRFKKIKYLYHIDCYRLRDYRDLEALDIRNVFKDPQNMVLIEWSDRVNKILPKKYIKIHIDHVDENTRKIRIYSK